MNNHRKCSFVRARACGKDINGHRMVSLFTQKRKPKEVLAHESRKRAEKEYH